ncbi:2,4-dienoyl-CoA reductase [Pseudooceanicola antarcticus]|uniref:12-oxophytodienoate reductase n=1 Tax=Pseudooceanicola antarcticus TaxID=1247613 RepID=A0A285IYY1_9RHOB|nr:NADH:flavin oxidoreductase [Pseudooceanicola antarcticus]PJE25701.1 12-oxophytodienoate reductase [Pseudooceanicola antarcticus]SNY53194.1 2,4-dienoyl-CoA reductase [Pseudooceanicola antarcticus]
MSSPTETLFRPFRLKGLELKNRIVMAPMTRGMAPEGQPGQPQVDYYRRRAEGEVGLILSEGTVIDRPASRNLQGIPFFHGEALEGWKQVIDGVHAAGGKMGPQIWHTGSTRAGEWEPEAPVESPSGLVGPGDPRGNAMTEADIEATIAAFGKAAGDAKRLGFDVAELHGAHGYLIDQFFWSGTNLRDDAWGGASIAERSRFAVEAVRAARAAVGPDFPLILRLSQWKQQDYTTKLAVNPQEMEQWLQPLVEAGVDIIHASQRRFWEPEFPEIDGEEGLNFAGWAKKLTGVPTISVGSVGLSGEFLAAFGGEASQVTPLDKLVRRMENDEFDLIAVGRALLSDADWVSKVRAGASDQLRGFNAADLAELV